MANRYQPDDTTRRYGRGYGRQEEQFEAPYGYQQERSYGQLGERPGADYGEQDTSWQAGERLSRERTRSTYRPDDSEGYSRFAGEPLRDYDRHSLSHPRSGDNARSRYAADRTGDAFASGAGSRLAAAHGEWHDPNDYGAPDSRSRAPRGAHDDGRNFFEKAGDEIAGWFGGEGASGERGRGYRGHGPANYTRSDERIRDDVNDRLTDDYRADARNISVVVEGGEVTLNGTVPTRDQKRRAEDVVEDLSGVKHVQNNLRVQDRAMGGGTYDPAASGGDTTTGNL